MPGLNYLAYKPEPYRQRKPLSIWVTDYELPKKQSRKARKEQEEKSKLIKIGKGAYKCPNCCTILPLRCIGGRIPQLCPFCWSFIYWAKKKKLLQKNEEVKKDFCKNCLQWPISIEHKEWKLCTGCYSRLTKDSEKRKNESEERKEQWKMEQNKE